MTTEEANEIIAKFMEYKSCYSCKKLKTEFVKPETSYFCDYTEFWDNEPCDELDMEYIKLDYSISLDSLVPAIKKYSEIECKSGRVKLIYNLTRWTFTDDNPAEYLSKELAKAIQELREE